MSMSAREIFPVIVILILHIVTVAEGTNVERVNDKSRSVRSPDSKNKMANVMEGSSEEPSSRAIFLRAPAQLTQEDLELIDKRVVIKVTLVAFDHTAFLDTVTVRADFWLNLTMLWNSSVEGWLRQDFWWDGDRAGGGAEERESNDEHGAAIHLHLIF